MPTNAGLEYRQAFRTYLRKGQFRPNPPKPNVVTPQYVWRTRGDNKVRASHAANEGRVFSWTDTLPTGHPGDEYGCRCGAFPYYPGVTEYAYHQLLSNLGGSSGRRWNTLDFFRHFYFGGGRTVSLRSMGHLKDIVEEYAYYTGAEGAYRRLSNQIAKEARNKKSGPIRYPFGWSYDFSNVDIAHGGGVVEGRFAGFVSDRGGMLFIRGEIIFNFSDEFTDVAGIRDRLGQRDKAVSDIWKRTSDFGGLAYDIKDSWATLFEAEVLKDDSKSIYK